MIKAYYLMRGDMFRLFMQPKLVATHYIISLDHIVDIVVYRRK